MRPDLVRAIDNLVAERREIAQLERIEMYGEERNRFFASELGFCNRKIAYEFFGMPRLPMDSQTLRKLENGNFLEQRFHKYFSELGVLVDEEVSVSTQEVDECPVLISGRLDFIIDEGKLAGKEEQELAIVELKSINTWGFKDVTRDMRPQLSHLYQITMYMWLTGIHKGWVVYEDKNDQTLVAIPIIFDEKIIYGSNDNRSVGLIKEITDLAVMIENKQVPPRCPNANPQKFPCKWKSGNCDYYDHCYNPVHEGQEVPGDFLEIMGKKFDLTNPPEGFTAEELRKMAALLQLLEGPPEALPTPVEKVVEKPEKKDVAIQAPVGEAPDVIPANILKAKSERPKTICEEHKTSEVEITEVEDDDRPEWPDNGTIERRHETGDRYILCGKCASETVYKKIGNNGTIKCKACGEKNFIVKNPGQYQAP